MGFTYRPRRHWCFLGGIDAINPWITRLFLTVRDVDGNQVPIFFYTPDGGVSTNKECKVGYTIAVLYPEKHEFLDRRVGFRVEELDRFKVRAWRYWLLRQES